uniref:grifin isoform X3 n=1 Tax=Callithrix jacchus TaxID=9483 RepID=UPI0023DD1C50|nr:grifin isoform X3 [Callithrix jacchus]
MGPQKPGQGSAAKPPIPNLPLADGRVRVPGGTPDPGGRARSGSLPRICHSCGKGVASFPDPEGVKWPPPPIYIPGLPVPSCSGYEQMAVQFEAFCAGGLAPGWSLLVQGQADSGEDRWRSARTRSTSMSTRRSTRSCSSHTVRGHWAPSPGCGC